ncbi:MAG: V-type ATP synthase subunit F [Eubacteriales bacterium]|nr:V-type ATP synthase subunit F [Eubacteriales bacterium]
MSDARGMGVVGEKDAVLAFRSMGMTVRPVQNADEAAQAVRQLAADG